jgi:hypothetical protein
MQRLQSDSIGKFIPVMPNRKTGGIAGNLAPAAARDILAAISKEGLRPENSSPRGAGGKR